MRSRSTPITVSPTRAVQTAFVFGWLRVGLAAGCVLAPSLLGRLFGMDRRTARRTGWLTRMVAGREAAIGAVTLTAARRGDVTAAFLPQIVADTGDVVALAAAIRRADVNRVTGTLVLLVAVAGVAVEVAAINPTTG